LGNEESKKYICSSGRLREGDKGQKELENAITTKQRIEHTLIE
jgi:hypothetical protein